MQREMQDSMRNSQKGSQLAGIDLDTLSTSTQLMYISAILALFGVIFYFGIRTLFEKPDETTKAKRNAARAAKRASPGKKDK